jgi:hypothetical protein
MQTCSHQARRQARQAHPTPRRPSPRGRRHQTRLSLIHQAPLRPRASSQGGLSVWPRCRVLAPAMMLPNRGYRRSAYSAIIDSRPLACRYYNLKHKYGLGSAYSPLEPGFVANHTNRFQAAHQFLVQSVADPALGLLIPYGGRIRITSLGTGLPCGLYPDLYEQSPTGLALALYCNATDPGAEFVYEVRALSLGACLVGAACSSFEPRCLVERHHHVMHSVHGSLLCRRGGAPPE